MINDQSDWYSVFETHKKNLRLIVSTYNREELEKFDELSKEKNKNGLEISSILNTAWFNLPDRPSVQYIQSFNALCSLCSENWVFQEDEEQCYCEGVEQ